MFFDMLFDMLFYMLFHILVPDSQRDFFIKQFGPIKPFFHEAVFVKPFRFRW